jgi:hypothetical protein
MGSQRSGAAALAQVTSGANRESEIRAKPAPESPRIGRSLAAGMPERLCAVRMRLVGAWSPIMVPATTGPAPKIPVTVVPLALRATASFFLVSRSWASRRRRSLRNSAASSQRAVSTAPGGLADSRIGQSELR